jgi:hypothetical protein
MNRILILCFAALAVFTFNSCTKNLDKVLFGTWSVTKVEGTLNQNGSSIFSAADDNPTGTVEFKNTGKGEQNYSFTLNDTVYPQTGAFTWEANQDEIIIERTTESNMFWQRIIDTDNKQKVSYNRIVDANKNWDYTLTLEK